MRDLSFEIKEAYTRNNDKLTYGKKSDLYSLYQQPKHTNVGIRILVFQAIVIAMICALAVGAVAGASGLAQIIYKKTANTDLTDEEKNEIISFVEERKIPEDTLEGLPELHTNEDGTVYGADMLGASLVAVKAEDGTVGYYYRDEMSKIDGTDLSDYKNTVERQEKKEKGLIRNWVYVYDKDGKTRIGIFILGHGMHSEPGETEEELIERVESFSNWAVSVNWKSGFLTFEQLEDENITYEKIDGEDGEYYESIQH